MNIETYKQIVLAKYPNAKANLEFDRDWNDCWAIQVNGEDITPDFDTEEKAWQDASQNVISLHLDKQIEHE